MEISFDNLLIVVAAGVRGAAAARVGAAPAAAVGRARDRDRDRDRPGGARLGRDRRAGRGPPAARARLPALPRRARDRPRGASGQAPARRLARASRSRSGSRSSPASCSTLAGIADEPLLIAIILASTSLGVIVPVLQDSGEIVHALRPAGDRRGFDRRLRLRAPAHPAVLGRVERDRREADPDRPLRARDRRGRGRRAARPSARGGSRRRWCASRTPARRSASAAPSCC